MGFFLAFILGVSIILLILMIREAFLNKIINQELLFSQFPESFGKVTIFFISDIHRRVVADKVIADLQGKADIVVIGGDLTEKGVPNERVRDNLKKLRKLGPVYFVWGNKDYVADYHVLDTILLDCGITVLANTAVKFESEKGDKISLLGVDDLNQNRDRLDMALLDAEKESFKILISHSPDIMTKVQPEHEISLILSGHTHGGQIHFLGYSPYKRGEIKKVSHTTILISNGYGTTMVPLRLGAPAECHLITIEKG